MAGADETILLRRLLADEPSAWRELVEKYSPLLLTISRRTFAGYGFTASEHDCEDVVSEVWSNLLRDNRRLIRQCLERRQVLPTLHVVTRNRTIDVMRRRKLVLQPLPEELPAEESAPEELPADKLRAALTTLSSKERTLIELFYLQRKKYREIEILTGIPSNSVGPTLARALEKLRASFPVEE